MRTVRGGVAGTTWRAAGGRSPLRTGSLRRAGAGCCIARSLALGAPGVRSSAAFSPMSFVYAFEAIEVSLPFMPLAARRALDLSGRKLSLEGWKSLPLAMREALVRAGGEDAVDEEAIHRALAGAAPAAVAIAPAGAIDARAVPPELRAALGPARTLDDARWAALSSLDRYALLKVREKAEKLVRAYDAIVGGGAPVTFTHLGAGGEARMVDVGAKPATARRAVASARVRMSGEVLDAIATGKASKGEVLAVARVAGIQAAKRTPEL